MKIFEGNSIKKVYTKIVKALKQQDTLPNQTKELTNACFIVHNPSTSDLHFGMRDISEDYSNAELKWYWSGDNKCETIGKHAKMWLRLSDDGITNNSAYGYILFKKYGFNQLKQIIELLKKDKSTLLEDFKYIFKKISSPLFKLL